MNKVKQVILGPSFSLLDLLLLSTALTSYFLSIFWLVLMVIIIWALSSFVRHIFYYSPSDEPYTGVDRRRPSQRNQEIK